MLAPKRKKGPSLPWSYGSWIYNYLCNECLSPLMSWVRISIRARCTTLCDEVCQRRATGRWFSPCPPVSSINKTDRHDIMEILLKVALNTIKQNKKEKPNEKKGRRWRDRMVVGFTTTYAISAYHHWCREFESRWGRGVHHYVMKFVSDVLILRN